MSLTTALAPLQARWTQLAARERTLLALAATVVLGAALWLLASVQLGRIATLARPLAAPPAPGLDTLFGGIAFIRSRPVVLGAISLDLFAVLLGGATALLPIYARDILASGPVGLGLLRSAPAVGALAMSLWLAQHPLERGVGRLMFASVAVFGVATLAFALSTHYALSLLALVVLGGGLIGLGPTWQKPQLMPTR